MRQNLHKVNILRAKSGKNSQISQLYGNYAAAVSASDLSSGFFQTKFDVRSLAYSPRYALGGGSYTCRMSPVMRRGQMPYRTEHGSHYHMLYGCCGATLTCSQDGLAPCSICSDMSRSAQLQQTLPADIAQMIKHLERGGYRLRKLDNWLSAYNDDRIFEQTQETISQELANELQVIGQQTDDMLAILNERQGWPLRSAPSADISADDIIRQQNPSDILISSATKVIDARLATSIVPDFAISPKDNRNIERLKHATAIGINVLFKKMGLYSRQYARGMSAIRNMRVIPASTLYSHTKKQHVAGRYMPETNQILCSDSLPHNQQYMSDVVLHEALHAMSTHWNAGTQTWVCGFGSQPRGRRNLTEGCTEWLQRAGAGRQRDAAGKNWGTGYQMEYIVADAISSAVGGQLMSQCLLNGDYDTLRTEVLYATHDVVDLDEICKHMADERELVQVERDAQYRIQHGNKRKGDIQMYATGCKLVAANAWRSYTIRNLTRAIDILRMS